MKKNLLSVAVKGALGLTAAAIMVPAMPAFAQDDAELVEEVIVTGSRIKRIDLESTSPVTVMTREDIDISGHTSVDDVLQNVSANSFGSWRGTSGYGAGAASTTEVDLRGLGATLVLLDGRRMPGVGYDGGQTQDVSQIPMALVERIEILRDGASAIYGSDAIAGVVNIITKKEFNGVHVSLNSETPSVDGGDTSKFEFAAGTSTDNSSLTFVYEHSEEGEVADTEFVPMDHGVSVFSAVPNAVSTGFDFLGYAQGDICGSVANTVDLGVACGYAYSNVTWLFGDSVKDSVMTKYRLDLAENLTLNARVTAHSNETQTRYAPTPVSTSYPFMAADNALNPFGQDVLVLMRSAPLGNRDAFTRRDNIDFLAGIDGSVDFLNGVDYSVNYQHTLAKENLRNNNLINDVVIQDLLDAGEFDAFNTAGRSTDEYLSYVTDIYTSAAHTGTYETQQDRDIIDATLSGELWSNGTVSLSAATGAEFESISFTQISDPASGRGQVSGGSGGDDVYADRDRMSAYSEFVLALPAGIELTAAARYDEYDQTADVGIGTASNTFDGVTTKIGAMWRPTDDLLLRASWGEAFRAPTFNEMYASQSFGFPSGYDVYYCDTLGNPGNDAAYCDKNSPPQHKTLSGGNTNLEPEEAENYTLGFVWNIVEDLSLEVSYFNIDYTNRIQDITAEDILFLDSNGTSVNVTRHANGKVSEIASGAVNYNSVVTSGFDVASKYNMETGYGSFGFGLDVSVITKWEKDDPIKNEVVDWSGDISYPEMRGNATVDWAYDSFFASWHMSYIDGQADIQDRGYVDADDYLTHNMQVGYNTDWNGKIVFGARNVLDEEAPRIQPNDFRPIDTGIYNPLGRTMFVRLEQSF